MPAVVDVQDYKELFRKTRRISPEINKDLRKRVRVAGRIGSDAAKAKIREWPVHGGISAKAGGRLHRGLRATLASRIRVVANGKTVVIRQGSGGITGQNAKDLPRDIDRGGWYHPVYGRRLIGVTSVKPAAWRRTRASAGTMDRRASAHGMVFQLGFAYFKKPIAAKQPEMVDEVSKVLDTIAQLLT